MNKVKLGGLVGVAPAIDVAAIRDRVIPAHLGHIGLRRDQLPAGQRQRRADDVGVRGRWPRARAPGPEPARAPEPAPGRERAAAQSASAPARGAGAGTSGFGHRRHRAAGATSASPSVPGRGGRRAWAVPPGRRRLRPRCSASPRTRRHRRCRPRHRPARPAPRPPAPPAAGRGCRLPSSLKCHWPSAVCDQASAASHSDVTASRHVPAGVAGHDKGIVGGRAELAEAQHAETATGRADSRRPPSATRSCGAPSWSMVKVVAPLRHVHGGAGDGRGAAGQAHRKRLKAKRRMGVPST